MEKRQRSESEDSNSTKELSSWTHITSAFTELHNLRLQNDIVVNKINKVHSKVNSREESKEGFTIKAGLRIQEVYRNAIDYAEQEIRVLKRTMEKVEGLIALQERLDSEKKRRKEMKQRPKIEEEVPGDLL
ncbi:hypothetical protein HK103_004219 [Boothiomyces macroporosus]|uniref:Uncharacterized protein n=1 Tax=Boothiomyces macroporosus TaxID=261099 RepID=A0AAD5UHN1_9FUNG|nr:hypothetical protein HK103_004219 [Boothiomyces macroporosus]